MESFSKYPNFVMGSGHTLFIVPAVDVMSMVENKMIINWRYNRPFDQKRVNEISEKMLSTKYASDTIKMAQIGDSKQLVTYDGVHRLLSLNREISSVAIDIMFSTTEEKVIEEFMTVNKSIPVPELYLAKTSSSGDQIKREIEDFVNTMVRKNTQMSSTARNCHKPHFNPDVLKNDLYELHMELNESPMQIIIHGLDLLNNYYEYHHASQLPESVRIKCERSRLYLFCEGRTINRDKLRLAMIASSQR